MRCLVGSFIAVCLTGMASLVCADAAAVQSPPVYDIPFDDYDEAVVQRELSAQVAVFLETMRRHQGAHETVFRNAMKDEPAGDERGKLIFLRNLADHGIIEGYEFKDGSLVRGEFRCLQQPINGINEFIGYYGAVKAELTNVFGAPLQDEIVWNNDLYQPLSDYWGVAVLIGHLRYAARWESANGIITVELTGNRHSRLVIDYQSNEYFADRQRM